MSIKKSIATLSAAGSGFLVWVSVVGATASTTVQTGLDGAGVNLGDVGTQAGLTSNAESNLPALVGGIINVVLGLLGIVFVILIIYSGIMYMISQGDKTKVETANRNIRNAVIGLIITVGAYAISNYVIAALLTATT